MIRIDAQDVSKTDTVVQVLWQGGVVCIPTDTTYGLAVDPGNRRAVERLFDLKGRPERQADSDARGLRRDDGNRGASHFRV